MFDGSLFPYNIFLDRFLKDKFELNIVFNLIYELLIINWPFADDLFSRNNIYKLLNNLNHLASSDKNGAIFIIKNGNGLDLFK